MKTLLIVREATLTSVPCLLEVDFAIHGAARLVRPTPAALTRRSQARAVTLRKLRDELGGAFRSAV